MPKLTRLAILDDYQGVALSRGPWDRLPQELEIAVFRDTITDPDALAARLAPFDAILMMRERTAFLRPLLERLPNLRLLITTGARNRAHRPGGGGRARRHRLRHAGLRQSDGGPDLGADPVADAATSRNSRPRCGPAPGRSRRLGWRHAGGQDPGGHRASAISAARVAKVGARLRHDGDRLEPEPDRRKAAGGRRHGGGQGDAAWPRPMWSTLHLVLSDRSRGIIGAADLARMKRGAVIVNTSRGPLIDQPALIAGAARKAASPGPGSMSSMPSRCRRATRF